MQSSSRMASIIDDPIYITHVSDHSVFAYIFHKIFLLGTQFSLHSIFNMIIAFHLIHYKINNSLLINPKIIFLILRKNSLHPITINQIPTASEKNLNEKCIYISLRIEFHERILVCTRSKASLRPQRDRLDYYTLSERYRSCSKDRETTRFSRSFAKCCMTCKPTFTRSNMR